MKSGLLFLKFPCMEKWGNVVQHKVDVEGIIEGKCGIKQLTQMLSQKGNQIQGFVGQQVRQIVQPAKFIFVGLNIFLINPSRISGLTFVSQVCCLLHRPLVVILSM